MIFALLLAVSSSNAHLVEKHPGKDVTVYCFSPGEKVMLACKGDGLKHNEFSLTLEPDSYVFIFTITGYNTGGTCLLVSGSKRVVAVYKEQRKHARR